MFSEQSLKLTDEVQSSLLEDIDVNIFSAQESEQEAKMKAKQKRYTDLWQYLLHEKEKFHLNETYIKDESAAASERAAVTLFQMTSEMRTTVEVAKANPDNVYVYRYNIKITGVEVRHMTVPQRLDDAIIDYYMNMLMERSRKEGFPSLKILSSHFYSKLMESGYNGVKKWTKKFDLFSFSLVMVPLHIGHARWALATFDYTKKMIKYYDSMNLNNYRCLFALGGYFCELHKENKGFDLNFKKVLEKAIPQQQD